MDYNYEEVEIKEKKAPFVLGIVSLVCSVAGLLISFLGGGLVFGLIGIILGIIGLILKGKGFPLKIAGIVIGGISFLISTIVVGLFFPSVMKYMNKSNISADLVQANLLQEAVMRSMSYEESYDSMQPYIGQVISFSEDEYYALPSEFTSEVDAVLGTSAARIGNNYTKNNVDGFAFMIEENGIVVHIYASTENKKDAYELVPNREGPFQ